MPADSLEYWWPGIHPGYSYENETPYNPDITGNQGGWSGGSPSPLFNSPLPENTVAPGIPAYNGWQEPDYSARTPMPDHWLNTMNAFAPTARNEMQGLLGMGALNQPRTPYPNPTQAPQPFTQPIAPLTLYPNSSGTIGIDPSGRYRFDTDYYGGTQNLPTTQPTQQGQQPAYSPPQLRPEQMLTPSQYPFKGQAPGYMDDFYNTPYSAYSQPTQQGQPYTNSTGLLGGPPVQQQTQFQGQAPGLMDAFYQQPSGYQGSPTIGIDPVTGAYTFAGNTQ